MAKGEKWGTFFTSTFSTIINKIPNQSWKDCLRDCGYLWCWILLHSKPWRGGTLAWKVSTRKDKQAGQTLSHIEEKGVKKFIYTPAGDLQVS